MPDDFINRQAAINIVCDDECDDCPDGGCDMYRRLKRLPAADVRPVVRGKWEVKSQKIRGYSIDFYKCSVCGNEPDEKYNFCPNCGADMREEGGT